jgi:hypothetical protein
MDEDNKKGFIFAADTKVGTKIYKCIFRKIAFLYICFFNINLAGKPHFSVAFITGFVC